MRKVVMYCDRCKKEFEKWNHKKVELYGVAEFVHDGGDPYLDEPKDLCESCYTELENWWNFTPKAESKKQTENVIVYCPKCGMIHRIQFLDNERFDVDFMCQCGEILKVESDKESESE